MPGLVPGTTPQAPPAGFATLSTLSLKAELRAAGVEVLGPPSRRESLLLAVQVPPALLAQGLGNLAGTAGCTQR